MRRTAKGRVWTLSLWSTLASLGCSGADPDVEVGSVQELGVMPTPAVSWGEMAA